MLLGVRKALALSLLSCLGVACQGDGQGSSASGGDASTQPDASAGSGGSWLQAGGWAYVSGDFPALVRRTHAATCRELLPGSDECRTDAECGPGAACACGGAEAVGWVNVCVSAECRSEADCGGRACLFSPGSKPGDPCAFGNRGLFCARQENPCPTECPGNGRACIYSATSDLFECQPLDCI